MLGIFFIHCVVVQINFPLVTNKEAGSDTTNLDRPTLFVYVGKQFIVFRICSNIALALVVTAVTVPRIQNVSFERKPQIAPQLLYFKQNVVIFEVIL